MLGLHNKPKAAVHWVHKLTGPKKKKTCRCKVERYCVTCVIKEPVSCTIIVEYVDIHMYNLSQWVIVYFCCMSTLMCFRICHEEDLKVSGTYQLSFMLMLIYWAAAYIL